MSKLQKNNKLDGIKGKQHHIVILTDKNQPAPKKMENAIWERDFCLSIADIEESCYIELTPVDIDLVTMVAAVAHIDRRFIRPTGGSRNFTVDLPVFENRHWNSSPVYDALIESLFSLTGDNWSFNFSIRPRNNAQNQIGKTPSLPLWTEENCLIPYSGGLDSWATLKLAKSSDRYSPLSFIALLSKHSENDALENLREPPWVKVSVELHGGKHAETSFRTRSLIFLCLAALIAYRRNIPYVLIPESGQGAIGSSLIPSEIIPSIGTHPQFTYRLRKFLSALWGHDAPRFQHPNIWKTKSEVISELYNVYESSDLFASAVLKTHSCARRTEINRRYSSGRKYHCGICSGCLFRRLALVNAGFESIHTQETYVYKNIERPTLRDAISQEIQEGKFQTTQRDIETAKSAIIAHRDLANLSLHRPNRLVDDSVEVFELSKALELDRTEAGLKLRDLVHRHRQEWHRFMAYLGPDSWITAVNNQAPYHEHA